MGVKNWNDLIPWRWVSLDELNPRIIAIDAPNYLTRRHQSYAYGKRKSTERIPTSHLSTAMSIIKSFLSKKIVPVFVFDGPPEALKRPTNPEIIREASRLYGRFVSSKNIYDSTIAESLVSSSALFWYFSVLHIKDLCSAAGIPAITAASEAEMTAAVLCKEGKVGTVLSNDVDTLLFGSPYVARAIQLNNGLIERCRLDDLVANTNLSLESLRDLAIVCGCDFHPGVKGIGPRKGTVLLKQMDDLEHLVKSRGYSATEIEEFLIAREVFDETNYISTNGINTGLGAPIVHRVTEILAPVMGVEHAERQTVLITKLWKGFGTHQSTLEQWV